MSSLFDEMMEEICEKNQKISDLEAKLSESEKSIQAYEEIVEQKDKEISFANRDKTCIVKQLNDPKAYVLLEDYKKLKQQLAEKEKSLSIKSVVRTLMKDNNLDCTFRDKTNAQIQQCGDVYNSNYGYFNFEDDYDESLNNKTDSRFDITSIDLTTQDKISFAVEQLEKVKEYIHGKYLDETWHNKIVDEDREDTHEFIDNQIKQLKEGN